MLCSVCRKNAAVIFIKELKNNTQTGLCLECAKAKGINPMQSMIEQFKNIDPDTLESMNKQFEEILGDMNPDDMENNPFSSFVFGGLNNDNETVKDVKEKKTKKSKTKSLDIYGTNLTEKATNNELDLVVGRDKELQRMIQILNRRNKNNPALIGEPGVGKTALVNALAIAIANKKVPFKLLDKQVYLLDMTSLVAGTQFRGQFEARVKSIIEECKDNKNIILAIDEVHTIIGSDHENSMNVANMLKPALANGYVQVIGATTLKEYRKYIEKDTALERRFQTVIIDEPSPNDTVKILKGIKKYYEDFHFVKIPDNILIEATNLSCKYIHDRFLPDKAIDLIDEAASRVNLDDVILGQLQEYKNKLNDLINTINNIEQEGVNDYLENHDSINKEESATQIIDYERLASLTQEECLLKEKIEKLEKKVKAKELTYEHLAAVIELWTKIPVTKILTSEKEKLLNLKNNLSKHIIGQDNAIEKLTNAILRKRAGIQNISKPPSFIFVGPTGVGKTALVKRLAYELFDNEEAIIKLDMSEYSESHSTSKLIGSPPGYVGYDEAGQLTEKVRRNPYSIILFDEIEKAHSSIYNILLQILDEGKLTDSQGKSVSFKHTIIILTSNLGTNFKNDGYGFSNSNIEIDMLNSKINDALKDFFTPEFLNRIDNIINFNKLNKDSIIKITKLLVDEFIKETSKKGFKFKVTNNVIEYLSEIGYDSKFGARPIKRAIQDNLENVIALIYIKGEITTDTNYLIDLKDKQIIINEFSVLELVNENI
jgi:ATP-dependent Clp protease ATP-binding subunit ClpA